MKKILLFMLVCANTIFAQDSTNVPSSQKIKRNPVKRTFENPVLINHQTVENLHANMLGFIIQHRFGVIKNAKDLFGIYAPSNIRIGLAYGITKRISLGIGTTKNKKLYDLEWKYSILKQAEPGIPFTISYHGNIVQNASPKENFINQDSLYKPSNRFSYFHELIVGRKFNTHFSLQLSGTFTHFNIVDTSMQHEYAGASIAGRYRFSPQSSAIFEFDYPLTQPKYNPSKPNIGLGIEISTGGHQFQIFVCSAEAIINQEIRVYNQNDFTKKQLLLGFNITRQWGFSKNK